VFSSEDGTAARAQRAIRVKSGSTERRRNIMRALVLHHNGALRAEAIRRATGTHCALHMARQDSGQEWHLKGREEAASVQGEGRGRDSSHTRDRRRGRSLMRRPRGWSCGWASHAAATALAYWGVGLTRERTPSGSPWQGSGVSSVRKNTNPLGRGISTGSPPPPPGLARRKPSIFI
jgi:hypothetical protein